jgi:hypothetical protein
MKQAMFTLKLCLKPMAIYAIWRNARVLPLTAIDAVWRKTYRVREDSANVFVLAHGWLILRQRRHERCGFITINL